MRSRTRARKRPASTTTPPPQTKARVPPPPVCTEPAPPAARGLLVSSPYAGRTLPVVDGERRRTVASRAESNPRPATPSVTTARGLPETAHRCSHERPAKAAARGPGRVLSPARGTPTLPDCPGGAQGRARRRVSLLGAQRCVEPLVEEHIKKIFFHVPFVP